MGNNMCSRDEKDSILEYEKPRKVELDSHYQNSGLYPIEKEIPNRRKRSSRHSNKHDSEKDKIENLNFEERDPSMVYNNPGQKRLHYSEML